MRKSLLTSSIIGLARKPLDEECLAAANQLVDATCSPAQKALSLASAEYLGLLTNLPLNASMPTKETQLPPPYSGSNALLKLLDTYLKLSAALSGMPEVELLLELGLSVPPQSLLWYLETAFRVTPKQAKFYAALGKRGVWLASQHPKFKTKVAFLAEPKLPDSNAQGSAISLVRREAFALYHLALAKNEAYSSASLQPVENLIQQAPFKKADKTRLLTALHSSQSAGKDPILFTLISLPSFAQLLVASKPGLSRWDSIRLSNMLQDPQTINLLNESPFFSESLDFATLDTKEFEAIALRELCQHDSTPTGNRQAISKLATSAVLSDNPLLEAHPILPLLASRMGEAAYADILDLLEADRPSALREKQRQAFLAASQYPFSSQTSLSLLEAAASDTRSPSSIPAIELLTKLNWNTQDELEEVQRTYNSPTLSILISFLKVKAQLLKEFAQHSL